MAVKKADFSPLRGRKVTIWRDADAAGAKAELMLVNCLTDVAVEIRTVNLDDVAAALGEPLPPGVGHCGCSVWLDRRRSSFMLPSRSSADEPILGRPGNWLPVWI